MDPSQKVTLTPATRELLHTYYRDFENDPDLFMDMDRFVPFHYDPDRIDARFDAWRAAGDRVDFLILRGEAPIGELALKHIDREAGTCELSIHLQNDRVKGRGYGARAEQLALRYAFEVLKLDRVLADAVVKNTRSQHVLEKVGFTFLRQEGIFRYYEFPRSRWAAGG